ncbi:MAG: hypothetical protein EOP84_00960 [Verrucomicrobiaceae bacterium]|nr:MAG: hypothetical protein EOP84_00960 [Verrucomicrobiaceae bacterium]
MKMCRRFIFTEWVKQQLLHIALRPEHLSAFRAAERDQTAPFGHVFMKQTMGKALFTVFQSRHLGVVGGIDQDDQKRLRINFPQCLNRFLQPLTECTKKSVRRCSRMSDECPAVTGCGEFVGDLD